MIHRISSLLAQSICLLTLALGSCIPLFAQPQYFLTSNSAGSTSIPLNSSYNKTQWIYGPDQFHDKGISSRKSAPYGNVRRIYFKLGDNVNTNNAYTDFTIKLSQDVGTDTSWSNNAWNTTLQPVFYKKEFSIQATKKTWVAFDLPHTFVYDPTKSIAVEISVSSGTGLQLHPHYSGASNAKWGQTDGNTGLGTSDYTVNIGFDFEDWRPNNAGIRQLVRPPVFCAGRQDLKVELVNNGSNPIDSVIINWSLKGAPTKSFWYASRIDTFGSTAGNSKIITVGVDTFTKGQIKRLIVWTELPNNTVDSFNGDDTLIRDLMPGLNGNYSIGDTSADYSTFEALSLELNQYGVCGPVNVRIDSGQYSGRLVLGKIRGTNATNSIVIAGKDVLQCTLQNDASSSLNQQTILLNGTSHVTIKNLSITALDSQFGVGIQLLNCKNIWLDSCNINLLLGTSSNKLIGIAGTGALYDVEEIGYAGDSNYFSNNTIIGGSTSIAYSGNDSLLIASGARFVHNQFLRFKKEGMKLRYLSDVTVNQNEIVGLEDSLSKGISIEYTTHLKANRNRIQHVRQGLLINDLTKSTDTAASVFSNNIIVANWIAALMLDVNNMNVYHNSFQSNGPYTMLLENPDSCNILNNIFYNLAGKNVFYVNDSNGLKTSNRLDYNNYYTTATNNAVKYKTVQLKTVSDWFKSDTTLNKKAFSVVPGFVSKTDLHIDSIGDLSGINVGITRDYDNDTRCSMFPTLGADQFTPGVVADTLQPKFVCNTGCLTYDLPPRPGYNNSSYNVDWIIDSIQIQTRSGYKSNNWSYSAPTSRNASISFCPDSTEIDSAFELFLVFRDLTGQHCFHTFASYILVGASPNASFSVKRSELCLGDSVEISSAIKHGARDSILYLLGDGQKRVWHSFNYLYDDPGWYTITKFNRSFGCIDSSKLTVSVGTIKGIRMAESHPFRGFFQKGVAKNPDRICTADTTTYQMFPPTALGRFTYDSLWTVDWIDLSTTKGVTLHDTIILIPDKFKNFRIRLFPPRKYLYDTLVLSIKVKSLINSTCDTVLQRYIVLRPTPEVGFKLSNLCFGEDIIFTDTSTVKYGPIDRQWIFGNGKTSYSKIDTQTYKSPGQYDVSLIAITNTKCHAELIKSITIYPRNKIKFIADDSCVNSLINFQDTSEIFSQNPSWDWDMGDGTRLQTKNVTHTFTSNGTYSVKLKIEDGNQCQDSFIKTISVHKSPDIQLSVLSKCENKPVVFVNQTTDTIGLRFLWIFGDGDTSVTFNPTYKFKQSDSAKVVLKAWKTSGCMDSIEQSISFDSLPKTSFVSQNVSTYVVQFTPKDSSQLTFKWYFGDGDSSSELSPQHTYVNALKTYEVQCKVTNSFGCDTTLTDSVTVGVQSTFSNANGYLAHRVFPNPFSDVIYISINNNASRRLSLTLTDVLGHPITHIPNLSGTQNSSTYEINTSSLNLDAGIYFVILKNRDHTYIYKVLKLKSN